MFVVPDLATAEYIQEYYFPGASIDCFNFEKPRKKVKGTETREKVQDCKAQGMTQKQAAESLGMGIATIKRNWN